MTLRRLQKLAAGSGLPNYNRMTKRQLFEALQAIAHPPFVQAIAHLKTIFEVQDNADSH
jgi:D-alanyl-D-alanine carboxypeptidase